MSAPVNGKPELELTAAIGVVELVTVIAVVAESPLAPFATMVCAPSAVPGGIDSGIEKEPFASAVTVPSSTGVLCRNRVMNSFARKPFPITINEPPGPTIAVFVAIPGALGGYGAAIATPDQPSVKAKPATTATTASFPLIGRLPL